jgi:glycyl-tRNA synthetase
MTKILNKTNSSPENSTNQQLGLIEKIVSLCKRRGFIFPSSEIYGGMANSWDYGPLGVELKNNIKQAWWKKFVQNREDMIGLDASIIMNPKVWEASGHMGAGFADELVECKKCHKRFRLDEIKKPTCPDCDNELTKPVQFNLMFKTFIGPKGEVDGNIAYLRPETAQGIFVNFKNVLDTTRKRLPFGVGQIGKAFRNEITPGNFIFRTREFEQMEIEYFIEEKDWQEQFNLWLLEMRSWITFLGINTKNITELHVGNEELAHYSKKTIDFEYNFPFGKKELYGLAYRTDFDLKNHGFSYTNPQTGEKTVPHVIEPSLGVDRTVLAVLCEHYTEEVVKDDTRTLMKFPYWMSPIKVAILPLSKKEDLSKLSKSILNDLKTDFVCEYDETQSIGKRYRRQDEIGTPFCITIDFESLEDKAVTVRERETMKQERVSIKDLKSVITKRLNEK